MSKTRPAETVREAYAAGCRWFGENRLQELRDKASELGDLDVRWSVIGHVQRNKAALVVALADELQSLDSLELAAELDRRLEEAGRTLDVLVQVNTSGESTKAGLAPDEVPEFAAGLSRYPRLVPRGLMTIALPSPDQELVAACFDRLVSVQAAAAVRRRRRLGRAEHGHVRRLRARDRSRRDVRTDRVGPVRAAGLGGAAGLPVGEHGQRHAADDGEDADARRGAT